MTEFEYEICERLRELSPSTYFQFKGQYLFFSWQEADTGHLFHHIAAKMFGIKVRLEYTFEQEQTENFILSSTENLYRIGVEVVAVEQNTTPTITSPTAYSKYS